MLRSFAAAIFVAALGAQSPAETKTTHVLATLTVNAGTKREEIMKVMQQEVQDTVRLHVDGRIAQWFARADGKGVVFLVNATSVEDARETLSELPLIKEKLATFEFMALGPLTPLRLLLKPEKP